MLGTVISQGVHPAAIVVSPVTLPDNYGTFWNNDKRILTINMEEIHEVSLVKYDLLGLVNVEIIDDACKLIGIPYPKAHKVNWDDDEVWEHIGDSGIGIFQLESDFATSCMRKMKCHSINDLSMVNGCIRPAGESYRDELLSGKIHKNVSPMLDELFKDERGFLVFQEQSIKFLTDICGLEGSEADNIRRAIGRKQRDRLDKALPQILEGYCEKSTQPREVAEQEAKEFLQILEDSAEYQFGFNHSTGYSMIGYYCAWLRYYYPVEFITAMLNNAKDGDDIKKGTSLAQYYDIPIKPIKFRFSEDKYSCDGKQRVIYKGMASIKYLNDTIADELNTLKDKTYDNFIDLLVDIKPLKVNSKQLDILIKLNYFEEFGDINYLLKVTELFDKLYGKKNFKIENNVAPEYLLDKYAAKRTPKMFKDVDTTSLLRELCDDVAYFKARMIDRIIYENGLLGYTQIILPNMNSKIYFVSDVTSFKKGNNKMVHLYRLKDGETLDIKIQGYIFNKKPIRKNDVLEVVEIANRNKSKLVGRTDDGKPIFEPIEEREDILTKYKIMRTEDK